MAESLDVWGLVGCLNWSKQGKLAVMTALLAGSAVLMACQDLSYVGTYEVYRVVKGKPVDNKTLPPGQVLVAEVKKDGKFLMRDFLSGFEGKWSVSGKRLIVTIDNGPAGKMKKPQVMTLQPTPNRTRLVIVEPKNMAGMLELHWDPKAFPKWNARVSAAMKQASDAMKKGGG